MFINTETLAYPVAELEIKRLHPSVSWAQPFVAPEPFAPVLATEPPEHDDTTQYVEQGQPVKTKGKYYQTWTIKPRPPYVPEEVEGWQAEVAMRATPVGDTTVWDRVQDLIAAMPDGIQKITAQTVLSRGKIRRDSPMLAQLAPMVPLSEGRVDDLLRLAAGIEA